MICHEFKGGTGTASRVVVENGERYTVGALVQANYGARDLLARRWRACRSRDRTRRGAGTRSGKSAVPPQTTEGSIIVVLATDAPLIPLQCQRLARRATTGLSWVGGIGANGSGDIFIAFSTGNHIGQNDRISSVNMLAPDAMTSLFQAAAEATEEAILNAMCMAETMSGRDGRTIHALPLDLLQEVMRRYRPSNAAEACVKPHPAAPGRR